MCRVHSNNLEEQPVVFVVEADSDMRARIRDLCRTKCQPSEEYNTDEGFSKSFGRGPSPGSYGLVS
jgi:hypothetical protein